MKLALRLRGVSLALLVMLAGLSPDSAPTLRVLVTSGNESLNVIVIRDTPNNAPFTLDPSRARIVLTTAAGKRVRLAPESGGVVKSRAWPAGTAGVGDGAYVRYALDGLPRGGNMYALSFEDGDGIRDANGRALYVRSFIFPESVSIPATAGRAGASFPDVEVERLRAKYLDRKIYITGGIEASCISGPTLLFKPDAGARVAAITRARGTSEMWSLGGTYNYRNSETPASYLALDPIIVTVTTPRAPVVGAMSTGNAGDVRAYISEPHAIDRGCPRSTFTLADGWEFDRLVSLQSPYALNGASAPVVRAARAGTVIVGMRRATVVAVWGYPSQFGTPAELNKLDEWRYAAPTPGQHSVRFVHDRVVAVKLPGHLP